MSEQKFNLERDLDEAREMAEGLADYVRGDQIYGTPGGMFGGSQPALTIGALLLRLRRLRALQDHLTEAQRATLEAAEASHETTRREWTVHYNEKLVREANSRLDSMRTYFDECAQNPQLCAGAYPPEALRRTIVQEIIRAMETYGVASAELMTKIRDIDSRLRRYTRPSEFVWADELAPVYPSDPFWWLHARPPSTTK